MIENKYPEHILQKLRQRKSLEENDKSLDEKFNNYTPSQAFREVLCWEGLIGWDETIKHWIEDIYGIDIDNL